MDRSRWLVVGLFALLVAGSGCVAPLSTALAAPSEESAPSAPPEGYHLRAEADDGGILTAFPWTIPEGALSDGSSEGRLAIEAVPVARGPYGLDGMESWGLFAFKEVESGAELASGVLATATTVRTTNADGALSESDRSALARSKVLQPGEADYGGGAISLPSEALLEEGETITLVVAASSKERREFSLAFRVVADGQGPITDLAEDALSDQLPKPAPSFSGYGFDVLYYHEVDDGQLQFLTTQETTSGFAWDEWSGYPSSLLPLSRTVQVSMEYRPHHGTGWGLSYVSLDTAASAGAWTLRAQAYGVEYKARGTFSEPTSQGLTSIAAGVPEALVLGDGEGSHSTWFHVQMGHVTDRIGFTVLQVDFGEPMEAVLGIKGVEVNRGESGMVPAA